MNCHHIVSLEQKAAAQAQAPRRGLPHQLWQQRRSASGTQYLVQAKWLDHALVPGTCLEGCDIAATLDADAVRWHIEREL